MFPELLLSRVQWTHHPPSSRTYRFPSRFVLFVCFFGVFQFFLIELVSWNFTEFEYRGPRDAISNFRKSFSFSLWYWPRKDPNCPQTCKVQTPPKDRIKASNCLPNWSFFSKKKKKEKKQFPAQNVKKTFFGFLTGVWQTVTLTRTELLFPSSPLRTTTHSTRDTIATCSDLYFPENFVNNNNS